MNVFAEQIVEVTEDREKPDNLSGRSDPERRKPLRRPPPFPRGRCGPARELRSKFRAASADMLSTDLAADILNLLERLEDVDHVTDVLRRLRAPVHASRSIRQIERNRQGSPRGPAEHTRRGSMAATTNTFRIYSRVSVFRFLGDSDPGGLVPCRGVRGRGARRAPRNTALELFSRNKGGFSSKAVRSTASTSASGARSSAAPSSCPEAKVILGFRESVTRDGIVARKDSGDPPRPEELAGVPVAVQQHTGSHYVAIPDDGGLRPQERDRDRAYRGPLARLRALLDGTVQAAALMEPFLSYTEKDGYLVTMAYNGLVVAPEDYDEIQFNQKIVERAVDRLNAGRQSTHR